GSRPSSAARTTRRSSGPRSCRRARRARWRRPARGRRRRRRRRADRAPDGKDGGERPPADPPILRPRMAFIDSVRGIGRRLTGTRGRPMTERRREVVTYWLYRGGEAVINALPRGLTMAAA